MNKKYLLTFTFLLFITLVLASCSGTETIVDTSVIDTANEAVSTAEAQAAAAEAALAEAEAKVQEASESNSVELAAAQEAVQEAEAAKAELEAALAEAKADQTEASMAQEPVEIEFWTLLTGDQGEILDKQVNDFNASQDRIKVTNINQGGYSELQQKLLASISAGNTPAVTMVDYLFVPFYAQQGVFEPLDNYMSDDDMADLIPGLLADLTYNGQVYALPYNRSTQGFYYNKDLLAEVGIDEPAQTWEEFAEHARIIREANPEYSGGYGYFDRWYFEPTVLQWGGRVNDEDCNVTLASDEAIAAMEFFQKLYHEDDLLILPSTLTGGFEEQNADFAEGRVAYLQKSTSWLTRMGDRVEFDWGFTMMPAGPNGRAVTNGGANVALNALATGEEKAAAWEFIHFLTDTEHTAEFHIGTGYMPSRYSTLQLPEVQSLHAEKPEYRLSIDQLEFATGTACVGRNVTEYHTLVTYALERIFINNEDAATVLSQLTADLQTAVDDLEAAGTLIQ